MRISEHFSTVLSVRFPHHLKCIRKGTFYIFLAEEAFFISERFSFRLTPLDRTTVRVGFPKNSLEKWKQAFTESGWAFILVDGEDIEEYP
jgi:DNA mismatch repair ATPase MutS